MHFFMWLLSVTFECGWKSKGCLRRSDSVLLSLDMADKNIRRVRSAAIDLVPHLRLVVAAKHGNSSAQCLLFVKVFNFDRLELATLSLHYRVLLSHHIIFLVFDDFLL